MRAWNALRMGTYAFASALLVGCATQPTKDEDPEQLLPRPPVLTRATSTPITEQLPQKSSASVASAPGPSMAGANAVTFATNAAEDPLRVHILNIGAGSCQLVECPGSDEVLVVDCGQMHRDDTDLSTQAITQYFDIVIGDGDTKVALSHADADHINRVQAAMRDRVPKTIWIGDKLETYGGTAAEWLEAMAASGVEIVTPEKGFTNHGKPVSALSCGKAETYVLAVNEGTSKNSKSLVLLVEHGNFRAIFSGDAEKVTEKAAMAAYGALISEATLLLGSHHGARPPTSNHTEWAAAVAPQIVVFSAGGAYGHPNNEAADAYRKHLFDTNPHPMRTAKSMNTAYVTKSSTKAEYVTALNGTIVVETDGDTVSLTCSLSSDCF